MTAKPYTAAELAGLREVAAVVKASDTSLTARLLATVAAVEGERDELREASRALVADLESNEGDWPTWCNAPRCRRLATYDDGDQVACDEHQGVLVAEDIEDLSYASSYRRLRALLEAKP